MDNRKTDSMKYSILIHSIFIAASTVWMILVLSCSFDYSTADLAEGLDSDIPDIQMVDASITYVRGTIVVIDSKNINIFSDYDKYDVEDIEFREMSKSGEIHMIGQANQASINTQNNDVTLTGDIWVRSNKDESELQTNFIQWKDSQRVIESNQDDLLTIKRDDGSKIQGYGFVGDADSRNLTLERQVIGELVVEDEETVSEEELPVDEETAVIFAGFDEEESVATDNDSTEQDAATTDNLNDSVEQSTVDSTEQ